MVARLNNEKEELEHQVEILTKRSNEMDVSATPVSTVVAFEVAILQNQICSKFWLQRNEKYFNLTKKIKLYLRLDQKNEIPSFTTKIYSTSLSPCLRLVFNPLTGNIVNKQIFWNKFYFGA